MTTKPHTITEEILKEFRDEFFTAYSQLWKSNDNGIGSILANGLDVERFLVEALHRKDEEWKKKVRGLRMEKMVCKDCGNDEFEWDCDTVECIKCKGIATDYNAIGMNQTIDKFNKKVDELLK